MSGNILEDKLLWAYDKELRAIPSARKFSGLFSFIPPLHAHKGLVILRDTYISIDGDEELTIPLSSITQLFLGFDEVYPASVVKSLGAFWQPLRIEFSTSTGSNQKIYLIIGYNGISSQNQIWYDTLRTALS